TDVLAVDPDLLVALADRVRDAVVGGKEPGVELLGRFLPGPVAAQVGAGRVAVGHLRGEEGVHRLAEVSAVEQCLQIHPGLHVPALGWGEVGEGVDVDVVDELGGVHRGGLSGVSRVPGWWRWPCRRPRTWSAGRSGCRWPACGAPTWS